MIVSMARTETLLDYANLEDVLDDESRELHADDLQGFLDVLLEEATAEGQAAYQAKVEEAGADELPWSAVRPRHYWTPTQEYGALERRITYAPPALSLVLARRPDLDPDQPGDVIPELDASGDAATDLYHALFTWSDALREHMGPLGWVLSVEREDIGEDGLPREPIEQGSAAQPVTGDDSEGVAPEVTSNVPVVDAGGSSAQTQATMTSPILITVGVLVGLGALGALAYVLTRPGASEGVAA